MILLKEILARNKKNYFVELLKQLRKTLKLVTKIFCSIAHYF